MNYSNYHCHTTYCDGKNSVREMIDEAVRLGCPQLGFSGHSPTGFAKHNYSMRKKNCDEYFDEIGVLREEYRGRIKVFRGIEQEYYCQDPVDRYDYVIGSVHYLLSDEGDYLSVDHSAEIQKEDAERYFGGSFLKYAKKYYDTVKDVVEVTHCDIVGHFDLVVKFNEQLKFIEESDPVYRSAAIEALEAVASHRVVFEINSGALSRGYREEFYPAGFLLDELSRLKVPVVFSSDAHRKEHLLFGFEKMSELAKTHKLTVMEKMEDILEYTRG